MYNVRRRYVGRYREFVTERFTNVTTFDQCNRKFVGFMYNLKDSYSIEVIVVRTIYLPLG